MLGGLAGAAFGKTFANRLDPQTYLLAGSALLVAGAAVTWLAHHTFSADVQRENSGPVPVAGAVPMPRDLLELLNHRYLRWMTAVGMITSLVGVLIEFQFYWSAARVGGSSSENLNLFANLYLLLNAAALLLQVFGMPPLQRLFGVHGSLMILPAVLVGASAAVAATTSTLMRAGLRVTEGGLKSSIHRSNWEQAYLPLDRPRRALAKILVDGIASRVGEGLAAAILLVLIPVMAVSHADSWLILLLIAGSVIWTLLTVAMRRSRRTPGLANELWEELRPDVPLADGCITVATLGEGLQRVQLSHSGRDA